MSKNIVVIGCGHWGKNLIRCFYQLSSLKGIYDVDEGHARSFLSSCDDIKVYSSLNEIFEDESVKAVVIATPVETHFDIAQKALDHDKHIFVEKPVTMTSDEARKLVLQAHVKNKVFQVGHLLEYHPAVVKLRNMIDSGEIGEIKELYSHRLNAGKVRQFENVWWSFAPHDILLILNTVKSSYRDISCFMSDYLERGVADSTITMFKFENGVFGHIYVSWMHPYKSQTFVVIGTKGAIEFNDSRKEEKLRLYRNSLSMNNGEAILTKEEKYEVVDFPALEPLKEECKSFLDCIDSHKQPLSSGQDGLNVMDILEQAMLAVKK